MMRAYSYERNRYYQRTKRQQPFSCWVIINFLKFCICFCKINFIFNFSDVSRYDYQRKKQNASVYLRVRPEMFGLKDQLRSMRLKAFSSYSYDFDNFVGGINITSQRHLFSGKSLEINYESFLLLGDASFEIFNNTPVIASLGYAYQSLSAEEQALDLFFLILN